MHILPQHYTCFADTNELDIHLGLYPFHLLPFINRRTVDWVGY